MATKHSDEQARRAYWKESYDKAYAFMRELYRVPLEECGEEVVSLEAAAREAGVEVTFSARPHVGGGTRRFFLRRGLVEGFLGAARAMNERGWVLHVEDAHRTPAMQGGAWRNPAVFRTVLQRVRWELGGATPPEDLLHRRLGSLLAACPRIGGHLAGAALDVSVFRRGVARVRSTCATPGDHTAANIAGDSSAELDRGGPYLEMSEKTPMDSPFVSTEARQNRKAITEVFEPFGFAPYPYEFWHYSRGDIQEAVLRRTGHPARYGPVDFDPADGKVRPVADADQPFVSMEEVREMSAQAMDGAGR
jgi:D-alanyl-D-alanine dipeptidase